MNKDNRILITGGKGFIGSHLIDELIASGYKQVFSMDRSSKEFKFSNLSCIYLEGNIADYLALEKLFEKYNFEYIFHFAGNSSVPISNSNPFVDFESNALGTLNLLQLALKFEIKKVVFTSSASVYGNPIELPMKESHQLNPLSNYAVSKLYGEKLLMAYHHTYGLSGSVIRIFSTYGPRQPRYILFDLLKKIESNSSLISLLGSSDTVRDYIYIKDTARAFIEVMNSSAANGEAFNLSGGRPISIETFVQMVCEILQISPKLVFSNESWKGDIKVFNADISKLESLTGFSPQISLEEGLKYTIDWFTDNNLFKM